MKKVAVLALALIIGVVAAMAVGSVIAKPHEIQAKAQWAEVYRTPAGLVGGADLIVIARHVMSQPGRVVGTVPYTYNGFAIDSVLKGVADSRDLVVEQTGGRMDEVILGIDDGGPFSPGKTYLLFLKSQGNGVYYQINHQARYEIDGDTLIGVDPEDRVVAAFNGRPVARARGIIERRVQLMEE